MGPKRYVRQETRSEQSTGYRQLGDGGAQGQGSAVLERKGLVDPFSTVNHDNGEEGTAGPGRQNDKSMRG